MLLFNPISTMECFGEKVLLVSFGESSNFYSLIHRFPFVGAFVCFLSLTTIFACSHVIASTIRDLGSGHEIFEIK